MKSLDSKLPNSHILVGDEPKQNIADDEFGLKAMVEGLAKTLTHRLAPNGYVLGIEGCWGSGKSTFVNFIAQEISKIDPKNQIIRFEPWMVGEKNALLSFYFGQLAEKIHNLKRINLPWWKYDRWRRKYLIAKLANKIKKYGEYVGVLAAPVGSLSATDPTGMSAIVASRCYTKNVWSTFEKFSKRYSP